MQGQSKKLSEAARLLVRGQLYFPVVAEPEAAEEFDDMLAAFGLKLEDGAADLEEDEFCLWPENVDVFDIWRALQTQWIESDRGLIGLSYPGVESFMNMYRVKAKKRGEYFAMIQAMEVAVLNECNKSR